MELKPVTWCIYVESGASKNLAIARDEKTWGVDRARRLQYNDKKSGVVRQLQTGDSVVFVHGILAASKPPPKGWPRLSRVEFEQAVGTAKVVLSAMVTSNVFEDRTKTVWAGPKEYPYRFTFQEERVLTDVDVHQIFRGQDLDPATMKVRHLATNHRNGGPHGVFDLLGR